MITLWNWNCMFNIQKKTCSIFRKKHVQYSEKNMFNIQIPDIVVQKKRQIYL